MPNRTGASMRNFRASRQFALLILLGSSLLIGIIMLLKAWKGIPTEQLTRDPNAIFDAPLYIGFLSQVGIFIWAAAAMICLYSSQLLPADERHTEERHYFFRAGCLLLLLGLDDAFLLHEQFFPFIGIPENLMYVTYAGLMLSLLLRFSRLIRQTQYPLLLAGLFCFSVSVGLDLLQLENIDNFLVEDSAKLTGILCWLCYFSHTAYSCTSSAFLLRKDDEPYLSASPATDNHLHSLGKQAAPLR